LYRLMANNKIKVVSVGIRNYYKVIWVKTTKRNWTIVW
jgi:hypothetical protein